MLDYDLMVLKSLIERKGKYDNAIDSELKRIEDRERTLIGKNPESTESRRAKQKCQAVVLSELPTDRFFVPNDSHT